jgi:hypothetical protein
METGGELVLAARSRHARGAPKHGPPQAVQDKRGNPSWPAQAVRKMKLGNSPALACMGALKCATSAKRTQSAPWPVLGSRLGKVDPGLRHGRLQCPAVVHLQIAKIEQVLNLIRVGGTLRKTQRVTAVREACRRQGCLVPELVHPERRFCAFTRLETSRPLHAKTTSVPSGRCQRRLKCHIAAVVGQRIVRSGERCGGDAGARWQASCSGRVGGGRKREAGSGRIGVWAGRRHCAGRVH